MYEEFLVMAKNITESAVRLTTIARHIEKTDAASTEDYKPK